MSAREAGRAADRERIDAIRARLEKATPGPWHASGYSPSGIVRGPHGSTGRDWAPHIANCFSDAEFIANSPSDLAWLLSRVDELEADAERLDWLEARIIENGSERIEYTDAWSEGDGYGGELSRGPREFWLNDDGIENGPTLRAAIDAAREAKP